MNSPFDSLIAVFEHGGPFLLGLTAVIPSAVGAFSLLPATAGLV